MLGAVRVDQRAVQADRPDFLVSALVAMLGLRGAAVASVTLVWDNVGGYCRRELAVLITPQSATAEGKLNS